MMSSRSRSSSITRTPGPSFENSGLIAVAALYDNIVGGFFQDKVVIISGGSSGIGRTTAQAFAAAGARVIDASRRATPPCDITKDDDVQQLVSGLDRIDILVNNAGIGLRAPFVEVKPEHARQIMEVNFFGAL